MADTLFEGNLSPDDLPVDRAGRLLALGLGGGTHPLEMLVERLEANDGSEWLATRLAGGACAGLGRPRPLFTGPDTNLDTLRRIKDRSKELATHAKDPDERLGGIAAYFLAIAAAARHHDTMISSQNEAELASQLLDLATVMPSPYTELLGAVAVALPGADS